MIFPVEVFERILRHCDPVDLTRWKSVSSTWYSMIHRIISKEGDLYYKKCLHAIPENMWSSVFDPQWDPVFDITSSNIRYISNWRTLLKEMQNLMLGPEWEPKSNHNNIPHDATDYSHVWIKLWRSWIGWHKLIYIEPSVDKIEAIIPNEPGDRITCVASLNELVAVGCCDGFIKVFRIMDDSCITFCILDAKQSVAKLQLLKAVESILVVTSLFNTRSAYTVTCLCKETGEIQRVYTPRGWTCSNPCNGSIYTLFFNHLSVEQSTAFRGGCMISKTFEIPPPRANTVSLDNVVAVGADLDQILLWTRGNIHNVYTIHDNKVITRYLSVKQPPVPVLRYVIFKPLVVACIGGKYQQLGDFGFSINGSEWKIYNLFKRFCAPITAILFHVSVLVLGFETGEVHIFNVKNVENLKKLNFDEMKSIERHLDEKAVISLSVMEDDLAQCIVATTIENVYLIRFPLS